MIDAFGSSSDSVIAPARRTFEISPSDSQDLAQFTKAIYVGNGGDIVLQTVGSDTAVTFANVQDGSILDLRCNSVRATGTTASNLVGLA